LSPNSDLFVNTGEKEVSTDFTSKITSVYK